MILCQTPPLYNYTIAVFSAFWRFCAETPTSFLRATRPLRDLKECDGTHSERCVRRVPTLRNKHEHKTKKHICCLNVPYL